VSKHPATDGLEKLAVADHFLGFQYLINQHQTLEDCFYGGTLSGVDDTRVGMALGGF
jgi:hypothetical protein